MSLETLKIPFEGESIVQGDTIGATVFDVTEDGIDLTGATIKMQLYYNGRKVLDISNGNGITINSSTQFTIDELDKDSNDLPVGVSEGDLEITNASGVRETYTRVEYTILKQFTK